MANIIESKWPKISKNGHLQQLVGTEYVDFCSRVMEHFPVFTESKFVQRYCCTVAIFKKSHINKMSGHNNDEHFI